MQAFDYIFNVSGNYTASIKGMTEATGAFTAEVESAQGGMKQLSATLAGLDLVRSAVEQTANGIVSLSESGIALDSQMHNLSAVAGVVGDDLKMIEGYARESAKAFGTDIGQAVESYKLTLSQLLPLLSLVGNGMMWIKNLQWASMWKSVQRGMYVARVQLAIMNRELLTGKMASAGFLVNIARATLAVVRFGTVGIFNALKGVGALILALVTGGSTSVAFATTASVSFGAFKVAAASAGRVVSVAIMSIPIIGWIAAVAAALIAIGVYFWNTSAKFRAVLKGLWASFKEVFVGIGKLAGEVFGGIGDLIKAAFSLDAEGIGAALKRLKSGFSDYGSAVGKAFKEAYDEEMASSAKEEAEKKKSPAATMSEMPQVEVPSVAGETEI